VQIPVHDITGKVVDQIEVSENVFGVAFHPQLVHQAMVRQMANERQGTADTKTMGQVAGSSRKLYRQKHTGRARRGAITSPLFRGGGVIFGPHPRSYRQDMPKKMRQQALRCMLSTKVAENKIVVLNKLEFEKPATKEILNILNTFGIDSSALVVTATSDQNILKSCQNIGNVAVLPATLINVVALLSSTFLVVTVPAIKVIEELWKKEEKAAVSEEVSTSA